MYLVRPPHVEDEKQHQNPSACFRAGIGDDVHLNTQYSCIKVLFRGGRYDILSVASRSLNTLPSASDLLPVPLPTLPLPFFLDVQSVPFSPQRRSTGRVGKVDRQVLIPCCRFCDRGASRRLPMADC